MNFKHLLCCLGGLFLLCACVSASGTNAPAAAPATPQSISVPTKAPTDTASAPTAAAAPSATAVPVVANPTPTVAATAVQAASTTKTGGYNYPDPPQDIPAGILPTSRLQGYTVFAWNNLGMHCFMSDYSRMLVLPPYNNLVVQIVQRTGEDPRILRSGGMTVNYSVPMVTQPQDHSIFWDYAAAFGFKLDPGVGLTGKKTSGTMDLKDDRFFAEGVPLVDYSDSGQWDPYPFFVVDLKDQSGATVGTTYNVAPISSEMRCDLCHQGTTPQETMDRILAAHDKRSGTTLTAQVQSGSLVMCANCHADPAMGVMDSKGSKTALSSAMHSFHANKFDKPGLPENQCQTCHPGIKTQCLRDAMYKQGITCTDCHGGMADVGDPARTPWVNLPQCSTCHGDNPGKSTTKHIDQPNQHLTQTSAQLYQNSKAHGGSGIYCPACHGSTHAVYPTVTNRDNQYSIFMQGKPGLISDCTLCHGERPDEQFWHVGHGE